MWQNVIINDYDDDYDDDDDDDDDDSKNLIRFEKVENFIKINLIWDLSIKKKTWSRTAIQKKITEKKQQNDHYHH